MNTLRQTTGALLIATLLLLAGPALADPVQTKGGAFYTHLPASADFDEVVDRLTTEILGHNWEVLRVQNIDDGLREHYDMDIQNKVIYACKSQYLADAIREDPNVTLLVPCRFAVYRVDEAGHAAGADNEDGQIVIGVANPITEADSIGIEQRAAIEIVTEELQSMLRTVAEYYHDD